MTIMSLIEGFRKWMQILKGYVSSRLRSSDDVVDESVLNVLHLVESSMDISISYESLKKLKSIRDIKGFSNNTLMFSFQCEQLSKKLMVKKYKGESSRYGSTNPASNEFHYLRKIKSITSERDENIVTPRATKLMKKYNCLVMEEIQGDMTSLKDILWPYQITRQGRVSVERFFRSDRDRCTIQGLGRSLASLHSTSATGESCDLKKECRLASSIAHDSSLPSTVVDVTGELAKNELPKPPQSIVHGELVPRNIAYSIEHDQWILFDWTDADEGNPLDDVYWFDLNLLRWKSFPLSRESVLEKARKSFVKGYKKEARNGIKKEAFKIMKLCVLIKLYWRFVDEYWDPARVYFYRKRLLPSIEQTVNQCEKLIV